MKAKRILTAAATVALVITSVFAGGNLTEVQAKDNDTPKKITLGYWESPNGELLTKEKGSLEATFPDTDVEWVEFQSGTDILTAMQSGSIDFATIETPPAALGLGGAECGDIVFTINEGFNRLHGDGLSTAEGYAQTSVTPVFLAAGEDIKEGTITDRVIRQVDVAPTIAEILGVRKSEQCEGAPVYQILKK